MATSKQHICIITQSHLCRNPRVVKEARLLSANYHVTIINSTYNSALSTEDDELIKGLNINIISVSKLQQNNMAAWLNRVVKKTADYLVGISHIQTPLALGYAAWKFAPAALKLNADAYICHQELGLYCGCKLLKYNKKVAFDFEDWYSEDLLPVSRRFRPLKLLKNLEAIALQKGIYCTTTSNALAQKLSQVYACPPPAVIYNVFEKQPGLNCNKNNITAPLKLFWFSQTIGPGRGIEQFIKIITRFKVKLELNLLGNISIEFRAYLSRIMPKQHQLTIHDVVPDKTLAVKIAGFDIGLALELTSPINRDYTITNKFFQYIQSGLPVIASKTSGQAEAFEKFRPGFMLSQDPGDDEIDRLELWLNNKDELLAARRRAIEAASFYNWENESGKLSTAIQNLLNNNEQYK